MEHIRNQFPILDRMINGNKLVYLDNAATTQKPMAVINSITNYYSNYNANVHRGVHTLANEATNAYENAHEIFAKFIGATMEECFFVRNATEGMNFIVNSLGSQLLKEGDVVVITEMEHHANIVPWQLLAKRLGIRIEWIPIKESDYTLDLDYLEFLIRKFREKVKVVSFVHTSNVLGVQNDAQKIIELAKSTEAITILDATQTIAHSTLDVKELDVDFMVVSGHKMYAPMGIGAVYAKKKYLEEFNPWMGGGEMISKVWKKGAEWADLPWKFEAGTPNVGDAIAFGEAISWMGANLDSEELQKHEQYLVKRTLEKLSEINRVKIFGPTDYTKRHALVSFTVNGMHPHDVASLLDEKGVAVRAGYHCAQPLHKRFELNSTVRASFAAYNTSEEVDIFVAALIEAIDKF